MKQKEQNGPSSKEPAQNKAERQDKDRKIKRQQSQTNDQRTFARDLRKEKFQERCLECRSKITKVLITNNNCSDSMIYQDLHEIDCWSFQYSHKSVASKRPAGKVENWSGAMAHGGRAPRCESEN
jgi:hypothetical protein